MLKGGIQGFCPSPVQGCSRQHHAHVRTDHLLRTDERRAREDTGRATGPRKKTARSHLPVMLRYTRYGATATTAKTTTATTTAAVATRRKRTRRRRRRRRRRRTTTTTDTATKKIGRSSARNYGPTRNFLRESSQGTSRSTPFHICTHVFGCILLKARDTHTACKSPRYTHGVSGISYVFPSSKWAKVPQSAT